MIREMAWLASTNVKRLLAAFALQRIVDLGGKSRVNARERPCDAHDLSMARHDGAELLLGLVCFDPGDGEALMHTFVAR